VNRSIDLNEVSIATECAMAHEVRSFPWISTMKVLRDFVLKLLTRFPMARWSPIPLRLIVGYGFMQHGFAKLSRGPDAFIAILQSMGVPHPHFMAWLTILTELLGGLAVLLCAFVTIVSLPMMAVLLVAMFKVHLPYGFSSIKLLAVTEAGAKFGPVGYEIILLYVASLAALVIGGSGPFSIDRLISRRFATRTRPSTVPETGAR
jgi:putative oxidoreductase